MVKQCTAIRLYKVKDMQIHCLSLIKMVQLIESPFQADRVWGQFIICAFMYAMDLHN